MLRHALALARRGLHIFPCRPRDKQPATPHGCKDATSDAERIEQWWRSNPDCNIAIATGERSHIFVLDIDDEDAENVLRRLETEHGPLPASIESITARGRHVYFEWPDRPIGNSAGRLGAGLDIRGAAGYVLAPPSVHPTGKKYSWSVDSNGAFANAPEWLLTKITAANGNSHAAATPPSEWRDLVCSGVDEGQRNVSVTRLIGHLLRRRVDPIVARELICGWNEPHCRPPLPKTDVERIIDSIAGRELKRRGGP